MTLIGLAASGLSMEVTEALATAAASYPEYVAIGLAQVADPTSGVRADILRRTLPMFTGLPGSCPTSLIVLERLQAVNVDLAVLVIRIALKRANSKQEVTDIDTRLKSLGPTLQRRVDEDCGAEELLGYWCVKADRGEINLEKKAFAVLERNNELARVIFAFAQAHAEAGTLTHPFDVNHEHTNPFDMTDEHTHTIILYLMSTHHPSI